MKINLHSYDWVVINSSGGKDSQAMLDYVVGLCLEQDFPLAKVRVLHANLGRMEWRGTTELAAKQAAHYGLTFQQVSRPQDLLAQVRARGMWPDSQNRYCTSDHKRDQIAKLITGLVNSLWAKGETVRVLNCMGLRAEESPMRRKLPPLKRDKRLSNGKREVDVWLPIHDWTLAQVWERIRQSGVEHHFCYDLGMPRHSCVFCVFASESALLLAGHHNRELLTEYVSTETDIGHTFRHGFTLASIQERLEAGEVPTHAGDWKN